jgi:hypothetical protein
MNWSGWPARDLADGHLRYYFTLDAGYSASQVNVNLVYHGGALKYIAPQGAMAPGLLAALKEHKPALLHDLHERAAIMQTHAGLTREEALREAAGCAFAPYSPQPAEEENP